ncbi:sensor histidine kinase [Bifidobacterium platyrrhinorum]|uniref:histidine kinase n=1 Tax=Bifidobacterium platyrrhinorum TaxID=2661628 RepID=A0A6L9SPR6_9BIFI|nr:histidine kinase [Bifidobacterium platyrrhinorum]NEG54444.1 sensor histidine kinase [Bifidobacterium platyrrhinorum]
MIPCAVFMCLAQCSFAAQRVVDDPDGPAYAWMMFATVFALGVPFILLARDRHPEPVFWFCCAVTAVFPYDPLLELMAMTSLLARRSGKARTIRAVAAGAPVAVWAQLRDALHPADASVWHMFFAEPGTGVDGVPVVMLTGEAPVIATAAAAGLIGSLIAVLTGLHIRSRATLTTAQARANAATSHAATLQSDLDSQQLADAIAAEAHDTLAHSLSLLALNASALQAETMKLPPSDQSRLISRKAEDIRRQAAGALDEAHQIIDMLRHPQHAWEQLGPSDDTALTRESLDALIGQTRDAGMTINTWIDIRDLSVLDDVRAKVAYRAVQEGLTNARRHAPGAPVSLEVTANPVAGVHVHLSNPTPPPGSGAVGVDGEAGMDPDRAHAGLAGLAARVRSAGGVCRYGFDDRRVFHVDVTMPWLA